MKKSLLLFALAALMIVFSCKKDEPSDPFKAGYTTETVEQSKSNVEQNAVDLVDQLDALSSANGIKVLLHLNELESSNVEKSTLNNPVFRPLSLVTSMGDMNNTGKVFAGLKRISDEFDSDSIFLSDLFDSIAGKYTYNFVTEEFIKTELANKVVFEFPGLETDLTNTAILTIDNFTLATISEPMEDWPSNLAPELPASLNINLNYNGKKVAGFSFSASYKSDGMPVKVTTQLTVDDFSFTLTAVQSPYTSASWTNTLKFKDDILFETYIAAEGDWSQENIDNSTEVVDFENKTHIEDIINNANAHVILMNLKVVGKVNIKPLGDTINAIEEHREEMTRLERKQATADAINANAKLIVIYRDSNTKIAEAQAYVESNWNDYTQEDEYEVAMRFVYADGSQVDVKTYVKNEMDNFYTSLNEFIDNLNDEYGLSIDNVNPGD